MNTRQMMADMNLGRSYLMINKLDSALLLENEAVELAFKTGFKKYLGQVYAIIGGIYDRKADKQRQKQYYYMSMQTAMEENNFINLSSAYFLLTNYYLAEAKKDSAVYYGMKNLDIIRKIGTVTGLTINLGTVYENIYHGYQLGIQQDSIFKYQGLTLIAKDSLYKNRIKNLTEFQTLTFKEQVRLQNAEKEKDQYQNRIRMYALLGGLLLLILIGIFLYRNNRQKQKANEVLQKTLTDLKTTQQQLVQSEKMASLGELTAGIAHEIQNPLNFVNNFSEVNKELLAEMNDEIGKGNFDEVQALAKDVIDNEEKINHHGKRADAIVKGMLQHSRSSNGQKEPTSINALADEYLRLAYHGLRAKDKSFNATLKTDYDETIGNISIIPQDIGRVILNLITNAFYAVDEKKKAFAGKSSFENLTSLYEPTVAVSTKKINHKVEIKVADNGNGIPPKVLDKIFQPFFTTKPTGQGTGLGLSLSYDIVKAHGGELKVETKENQGTEFIIQLPTT
jgi:two-component system NtrC family sensor kinase